MNPEYLKALEELVIGAKLIWTKEWADFANVCFQYWADRNKVPTLYAFVEGTKLEIREVLESILHVMRSK